MFLLLQFIANSINKIIKQTNKHTTTTQLFTVASDVSRVFFRRSKLQCLLSLDLVEVLNLFQHNLYLLNFRYRYESQIYTIIQSPTLFH